MDIFGILLFSSNDLCLSMSISCSPIVKSDLETHTSMEGKYPDEEQDSVIKVGSELLKHFKNTYHAHYHKTMSILRVLYILPHPWETALAISLTHTWLMGLGLSGQISKAILMVYLSSLN